VDHLWAGWRATYIDDATTGGNERRAAQLGTSLFEGVLALPDEEGYVVHRGARCSTILNAYPYVSGHLLVLPNRAVAELEQLEPDESAELWQEAVAAVEAVKAAYSPDGVNLGANLGAAAGAGVPDHLHLHVLPRWAADSNFMTSIAEARVLPEPLSRTWERVRAAWPPVRSGP
jgi:ATP adenylyltransferase